MVEGTNTVANIGEIVTFLVLILGSIGALYTAFVTGKKGLIDSQTKASVDIKTVELAKIQSDHEIAVAKQKADDESKQQKLDMADKVTIMYEKLSAEMDHKFEEMQLELDKVKEQMRIAISEKNIYREAGIRLIHAIEVGVRLRSKTSNDLNNCKECVTADQSLLVTLKEVKELFEKEI